MNATCYIRGVEAWNNEGPKFSRGADSVYDAAALMESLAVLDLTAAGASCAQQLPQDIARTVRSAYGNDPHGFLPHMWLPQYDDACEKRDLKRVQKQQKAGTYLLQSVGSMNQRRSLVNWFLPQVDEVNEDEGQRAVRDTQDTVEVLLLRKCDDGIHLLPWVGDEHADVEKGSIVPTTVIPDDTVAKIAVQCAVRLPMGLCMPDRVDALIASLEEACADDVACWQDSPWLAGKLALFLHGDADGFVSDELCGYEIRYSRDTGLGFVHVGHERSFVYDIADLYKAELSIPVAFETVAAKPEDIGSAVRHNIRDAIYDLSLMKRMTKDIRYLLGTSELEDDVFESDHVGLWDDKQGEVSAGKSYSDNDEWDGGTW